MTLLEAYQYGKDAGWEKCPNPEYLSIGAITISIRELNFIYNHGGILTLQDVVIKNIEFIENNSICLINDVLALKVKNN